MTKRTSVRAAARARYSEAADADAPHPARVFDARHPLPAARGEGTAPPARAQDALRAVETPLTAQARALYEDTVVPVREIARLAGVSERTLYK